ncbi:MAG TPA: hypothetical protein VLJ84_13030, partial [Usitatibacter sp.]|nr:hypothetical protein [Usitatibacter sp.]
YAGGKYMSTAFGRRVDFKLQVGDDVVSADGAFTTITLGQFVLQVVDVHTDAKVEGVLIPGVRNWANHMIRLWPLSDQPLNWPPRLALDDAELSELMRPFAKGALSSKT